MRQRNNLNSTSQKILSQNLCHILSHITYYSKDKEIGTYNWKFHMYDTVTLEKHSHKTKRKHITDINIHLSEANTVFTQISAAPFYTHQKKRCPLISASF